MDFLSFFFNNVLINPMLNILVVLYTMLFSNFGMALIVFTIVVRVATLPLTMKQTYQMRRMTSLQPKMKAIQERYAKDPQRRSKEMMALYKSEGVNPLGCLGPMVIQLPIWIGLYQALLKALGTNPDDLVGLSQRLYSWNPFADTVAPINSNFLWLDLANPDPSPLILPILVGISTWAQQKVTMAPSTDPRQASTNRMMLWMMPAMLGLFALSFPSGLALYWVVSNVIGVVIHGTVTRDWSALIPKLASTTPQPEPALQPDEEPETQESEPKEIKSDGRTDDVRKNRRRGNRGGAERARRKQGRGRNRNFKPR